MFWLRNQVRTGGSSESVPGSEQNTAAGVRRLTASEVEDSRLAMLWEMVLECISICAARTMVMCHAWCVLVFCKAQSLLLCLGVTALHSAHVEQH